MMIHNKPITLNPIYQSKERPLGVLIVLVNNIE